MVKLDINSDFIFYSCDYNKNREVVLSVDAPDLIKSEKHLSNFNVLFQSLRYLMPFHWTAIMRNDRET